MPYIEKAETIRCEYPYVDLLISTIKQLFLKYNF